MYLGSLRTYSIVPYIIGKVLTSSTNLFHVTFELGAPSTDIFAKNEYPGSHLMDMVVQHIPGKVLASSINVVKMTLTSDQTQKRYLQKTDIYLHMF